MQPLNREPLPRHERCAAARLAKLMLSIEMTVARFPSASSAIQSAGSVTNHEHPRACLAPSYAWRGFNRFVASLGRPARACCGWRWIVRLPYRQADSPPARATGKGRPDSYAAWRASVEAQQAAIGVANGRHWFGTRRLCGALSARLCHETQTCRDPRIPGRSAAHHRPSLGLDVSSVTVIGSQWTPAPSPGQPTPSTVSVRSP